MQDSRFVNDLLWVVNSPPLVHLSWRPNLVLSREDIDVGQLASFLSRRTPHRVGHYFEDLVRYYLIHHAGIPS